jgi:hypothetical protein
VAHPNLRAERSEGRASREAHVVNLRFERIELMGGPYDHAVRSGIEREDIQPLCCGDADPATLPDRIAEVPLVAPEELSA